MTKIAKSNWLVVSLLICASLLVRLWNIRMPLQGDEYSSLQEATKLGSNLSGILYFTILHFWMQLGHSDWWYRLLSVLLGMAAVPFAYWAGRLTADRLTGFVFATLVAISPFAVETSQGVRHYSLALTVSTMALTATLFLLYHPERRWSWIWLGISLLLLSLSHIFGILLSSILILFVYAVQGRWPRRQSNRLVLIGAGLTMVSTILLWPVTRYYGWQILQRSIDSFQRVNYQSSRGLSIVQVIKIPLTFYIFFLGYHVYPLMLLIVLPAAVLALGCTILGMVMLRRRNNALALVLSALSLIFIVFLVLDSLTPPYTEMASPHHVTIAWPAFALLLAVGASRYRRGALVVLILLISLVGLAAGWRGDWSLGGSEPDWRAAAKFASDSRVGRTAILHDGRSQASVARYFPQELPRIDNWAYLQRKDTDNLADYNRCIFVTNDFHADPRQGFDRLLERIAESFTWVDGRVSYPFFEYVLERKPDGMSGYALVPGTGQIRQPLNIYSFEFQDLHLPVTVKVEGVPLIVVGSFDLLNADGHRERIIPLASTPLTDRLMILSNVTANQGLAPGQQVAEVVLETKGKEILTFGLRLGIETESWDHICSHEARCVTEQQWHKRVAFAGQQAYPGAWRDFQAGLHGSVISLPREVEIKRITLRYLANAGRLNVWGLGLPPKETLSRVEKP